MAESSLQLSISKNACVALRLIRPTHEPRQQHNRSSQSPMMPISQRHLRPTHNSSKVHRALQRSSPQHRPSRLDAKKQGGTFRLWHHPCHTKITRSLYFVGCIQLRHPRTRKLSSYFHRPDHTTQQRRRNVPHGLIAVHQLVRKRRANSSLLPKKLRLSSALKSILKRRH